MLFMHEKSKIIIHVARTPSIFSDKPDLNVGDKNPNVKSKFLKSRILMNEVCVQLMPCILSGSRASTVVTTHDKQVQYL